MTQLLVVAGLVGFMVLWGWLQRAGGAAGDCSSTSCGDDPSCAGCAHAPSESEHVQS